MPQKKVSFLLSLLENDKVYIQIYIQMQLSLQEFQRIYKVIPYILYKLGSVWTGVVFRQYKGYNLNSYLILLPKRI